jgi:uncharacterized protein
MSDSFPPFRPAWWLPSGHAQTLWPALLRRPPRPAVRRESIETADGDFFEVDWLQAAAGPLVILLHGLSGSSRSSYIPGLQLALSRAGLSSVAMNFRGCGGRPNATARCYHSGETEDLARLVEEVRRRHPNAPLAAVGFSLGGNVLLKWLGEKAGDAGLFAAVAVSVPLQLNRCADRLDLGLSRIYRNRLLKELKAHILWKRDHLQRSAKLGEAGRLDGLGDLSDIRSFWDYDERVVARLYGFESARDYYQKSSSRQYLKSIAVPCLIIQSRDDPFMPPDVLPHAHELSPAVRLLVASGGGHVGFIAGGLPGFPRYWLEQAIPAFLQDRLQDPSRPLNPHNLERAVEQG